MSPKLWLSHTTLWPPPRGPARLLHRVPNQDMDVPSKLSWRTPGSTRACSSQGMQNQPRDHPDPHPGAQGNFLCDTHQRGHSGTVPGAGGGTPSLSGVAVPLALSSWRRWFVDSSAVTSFGDVSFRSPPVWEPDSSCSAAPVNSGQGMRATPAAGGESCRGHGTAAGASLPATAGLTVPLSSPGKGKSLQFSL